jgi:hypothetical protein
MSYFGAKGTMTPDYRLQRTALARTPRQRPRWLMPQQEPGWTAMRLRRIVHASSTVVETLLFQKQWPLYWTEEERGEFAAFIADRPDEVEGDPSCPRRVNP